jgi:hypothetical protein
MKKVAIGCAAVLVLIAIAIGLLIHQAPLWIKKGQSVIGQAMATEMRVSALESDWQPPAATLNDAWFPAAVGEWRLERSEPTNGFPELGLDRAGERAAYRSGAGTLDVMILPVTELERPGVMEKVTTALADGARGANGGTSRTTTTRGNRTHLRFGTDDHTRFWWLKGWLFVFRARGPADREDFPEEFLRSSSGKPAATAIEKP